MTEHISGPTVQPSEGLSLRDVMGLEIMRRTEPELVHGEHLLDRPVRWVHTSELAEVPSLLKGGELLLTTGLGLAHHGRAAHAGYVHQLADKHLSALALELGWYFFDVPEAILDAARERDLPLIALRRIVPFVEITEEIQSRIVHRQAAWLRLGQTVQDQLNQVLLRQEGLSGLVVVLSELVGCPVAVRTASGQIVAIAGASGRAPAPVGDGDGSASVRIDVLEEDWGALEIIDPPNSSQSLVRAVLEHGPTAIALTVLRDRDTVPLRRRLSQELVQDLLAERNHSRRYLQSRAMLLGFAPSAGCRVIGFAIGDFPPEDGAGAVAAAENAVDHVGGGLVAEVRDVVLGVIAAGALHEQSALAESLFAGVEALMFQRGASRSPLLALGPPVEGLEAVGRSLRDAESTLVLAREMQPPQRAVTARGMAADRLLSRLADEGEEMSSFVEGELGELIRYDAAHGSELVQTLWAVLTFGNSKSELSRTLHLRRQSLYQRIGKIELLIGGGLDDPDRRVSLILALKAHDVLRRRL